MNKLATILVRPMGAVRQSSSDRWKKRPAVLRYRDYRDEIRRQAGALTIPAGGLILVFSFKPPKSVSRKLYNQMIESPHTVKPDIDNLVKGFLDALLINDQHIWDVRAVKIWGEVDKIVVCEGRRPVFGSVV